jgi:hypothetical protein
MADDLPIFYEQQADPEANAMAAFPARDREAFAEHWARVLADDSVSRPLYAHVAKHNVASIRVLEKCGFTVDREERAPSSAGDDEVEEFVMRLGGP